MLWVHCLPTASSVKSTLRALPASQIPSHSLIRHTLTSFWLLELSRPRTCCRCSSPGDSFSALWSQLRGPFPAEAHLTHLPNTVFTSFLALAAHRRDLWTWMCSLVSCRSFLGPCPSCTSSACCKAGHRADMQYTYVECMNE